MDLMIISIPLGILLGYLAGGNLSSLEKARINGLYLIFLAFLFRFLANSPDLAEKAGLGLLNPYLFLINILAYILLYIFAALNWNYLGIKLFTASQTINVLPIFLNGGKMPFEVEAARKAGTYEILIDLYRKGAAILPSNKNAILWYLGDWIILPGFRVAKLISIGDIFLALAASLIIAELMSLKTADADPKRAFRKTQQ
jgi:hypothetical protein